MKQIVSRGTLPKAAKCSGCGKDNDRAPQRYCRKCHADDMKSRRDQLREQGKPTWR